MGSNETGPVVGTSKSSLDWRLVCMGEMERWIGKIRSWRPVTPFKGVKTSS